MGSVSVRRHATAAVVGLTLIVPVALLALLLIMSLLLSFIGAPLAAASWPTFYWLLRARRGERPPLLPVGLFATAFITGVILSERWSHWSGEDSGLDGNEITGVIILGGWTIGLAAVGVTTLRPTAVSG